MVFSIGTDIVDIARIERLIKRYGERFGRKVLSLEELTAWRISKLSPAFLAKRFAAKEAIAKALGTGIGSGVGFQNIIIRHEANGAPAASFPTYLASSIGKGVTEWHTAHASDQTRPDQQQGGSIFQSLVFS